MKSAEFLEWLANRMVHIYGESENCDFVLKTKRIAKVIKELEDA